MNLKTHLYNPNKTEKWFAWFSQIRQIFLFNTMYMCTKQYISKKYIKYPILFWWQQSVLIETPILPILDQPSIAVRRNFHFLTADQSEHKLLPRYTSYWLHAPDWPFSRQELVYTPGHLQTKGSGPDSRVRV